VTTASSETTLSSLPTSTVPELARRLATHLGSLTGSGQSVVVLVDPRSGRVQGHVAEGVAVPPGATALGDLVCSSDPAVVRTSRMHDLALRALARHWGTDTLLVAPCLFGNDVVAMVALPLPTDTTVAAPSLVRAVRALTDRFAAGVVRTHFLAAATAAA
jgi:hypothetical protein